MGRKNGAKQVTEQRRTVIVEMVRAGLSQSYVASFYGMPRSSVTSIVRRNRLAAISTPLKRRGPKHQLTERCIRRLLRDVHYHRFQPLHVIAANFRTVTGKRISVSTIRRYIHNQGIESYVAVSKPYLSPRNIAARMQWATLHQGWTIAHWSRVAFSDESSFNVKPKTLRKRVWRKVGNRYKTVNLVPTFKSGYVSISVWAAFSMHGRTPLIRIAGNLNQYKYKDILEKHLVPFAEARHGGFNKFILQQENCGAHRAKSVAAYLEAKGIDLLQWPAQSPDLNPIENAWAILKRRLRESSTYPSNADSLFAAISDVWDNMPDTYFKNLISSMASRVEYVKRVRGHSTKY